jgi:hypothetical protein
MVADDWMGLWFIFGLIVLATVVAVVAIWQLAATRRARAAAQSAATAEAVAAGYHRLAEEGVAVQRQIAEQLAEIRQSLAALQQILKDVE